MTSPPTNKRGKALWESPPHRPAGQGWRCWGARPEARPRRCAGLSHGLTGPPVGDALRSVRGRSRSRSRLALPSLVCPRPATRHPAADGRSCTASIRRIKGKGAVAGCALRQAGPRVKADAVRCRDAGDVISDRREAPAAPAMARALAGPVAGGSRQRTQCRPCRESRRAARRTRWRSNNHGARVLPAPPRREFLECRGRGGTGRVPDEFASAVRVRGEEGLRWGPCRPRCREPQPRPPQGRARIYSGTAETVGMRLGDTAQTRTVRAVASLASSLALGPGRAPPASPA